MIEPITVSMEGMEIQPKQARIGRLTGPLFLLLLGWGAAASGDSFRGKVVAIQDGDTLLVKDTKKKRHLVRLFAVDAPDRGQYFYFDARRSLRRLVKNKQVTVEWDRYDPTCQGRKVPEKECPKLGRVLLSDGTDVNLMQVVKGWAWHDEREMSNQPTPDRTQYMEAQDKARAKALGLWKERKPTQPWERRKGMLKQGKTPLLDD